MGGGQFSLTPAGKGPTRYRGTPTRRRLTLALTHVPTGLMVEKTALGPFTRVQAKEAKGRLYSELFDALEAKVAAKLRVPRR